MLITRHFEKRASERLGRKFKPKQIREIINQIKSGHAVLMKEIGEAKRYKVRYDNKPLLVVYNPEQDVLVTIMIEKQYKDGYKK